MKERPDFNEALEALCEQMKLTRGTIAEEGSLTSCPVSFTLAHPSGFYSSQVIGTVCGTNEEVMCYLMVVHTLPHLKNQTSAHIGRYRSDVGTWEFDRE